jgi:hypothetical protein
MTLDNLFYIKAAKGGRAKSMDFEIVRLVLLMIVFYFSISHFWFNII